MKISRYLAIRIGAICIVSPFFLLIIFIGDKLLLNFLNRNISVAQEDQKQFFDGPIEKINHKNIGKYISEGSLLSDATKRFSHHDSVEKDYKINGEGKEIIWILGDSWLAGIRNKNINNNIIGRELNENYKSIRLIGTGSFSPLLMQLAFKDRMLRYKEIPDSVVIFLDQTDIGDDFCRYRPSVIRDSKGKLLGVLNNNLNVYGMERRWTFHLSLREHKSGILLAFQRLIHAIHLRIIPSINGLTDCTEKELIAWQIGDSISSTGVSTDNYKKYFLSSLNEFIDTINSDGKRKKILLVSHDWARHSLPQKHKDYLSRNISSIIEQFIVGKDIHHLHVKTEDYIDKDIYDIYRYPNDRFSHLKDYSYLSRRIGKSLNDLIKEKF